MNGGSGQINQGRLPAKTLNRGEDQGSFAYREESYLSLLRKCKRPKNEKNFARIGLSTVAPGSLPGAGGRIPQIDSPSPPFSRIVRNHFSIGSPATHHK